MLMRIYEYGFIPKDMFSLLPTIMWFRNGSDCEHKSAKENVLTFIWFNVGITIRWGEK